MKRMQNWGHILMLALPSLFAFATQTVTGTINLILVGDLGYVIIAVVGVSNIIMYNVFAIFSGIGHTVNYLVAQDYGAARMDRGIRRTNTALLISLGVAISIVVVGFLWSDRILSLTGGSQTMVAEGNFYLELRFYAMAIGMINFAILGFLRGVGDTRTAMVISIVANGIMVVLTYGLCYGKWGLPELGVDGAGYAVLVGETVQLLVCLFVYWGLKHKAFRTRKWTKPVWNETKLVLHESAKLGAQEFSMGISMYIFTFFVLTLGDVAAAANEVALNVMSFGFMPAFAFGSTATILVGQAVGRKDPSAARAAGTDTALMGSLFLILLGTAELIWAFPIARMYSDDPQVYELAARLIQTSAYLQLFDGLYNFYAGGLRGIGDTTFLMRLSLVLTICLFVPLTYLFVMVFHWGSMGAWIALYSFLTLLGLGVMIRYYRTDWTVVQLKEAAHS